MFGLPSQHGVEIRAGAGQFDRQTKQFRHPPVHHRHVPPLIDHQNALADVFQGHGQSAMKPGQAIPLPQRDETDEADDQRQARAGQQNVLTGPLEGRERLLFGNADGDEQGIAGDAAVTDDRVREDRVSVPSAEAPSSNMRAISGFGAGSTVVPIIAMSGRAARTTPSRPTSIAKPPPTASDSRSSFPEHAEHLRVERCDHDAGEPPVRGGYSARS